MMKINTKKGTRNSAISAFLMVLLVIGLVLMSGCIDVPKETASNGAPGGDDSGEGSMDERKPIKCVFGTTADEFGIETKRTSTIYMADGKIRFDTSVTKGDRSEVREKYVILDGEWMYSWNNLGISPGTKIKLSEKEREANKRIYAVPGLNGQGYNCQYWTPVDSSKFIPPKDIEFTDRTK